MRIVFEPDCVWARLDPPRCRVDILKELDTALSFHEPGYFFTKLYKMGRWDGKSHLFDSETMRFPAGLVDRARLVLEENNTPVEIVDQRPSPPWGLLTPCVPELAGVTLHPDQKEAIRQALVHQRGCLALSVGFGKTELAAAVMKAAAPERGIFLVNKRTLMDQTAERFETRLGERIGRLGSGWKETRRRITVATIQTLFAHHHRYADFLGEQKVLICDEAHTIAPHSWFPILQAIHAPVRLGLSATVREAPRRMAVEAFLGPIIAESNEQQLIEAGRAATPTVWLVRAGGLVGDHEPYPIAYNRGVIRNVARNTLILDSANRFRGEGHRVLILVTSLEHGRLLSTVLGAPFLEGKTPLEVVAKAKRDFEMGKLNVVVASTIFDFGQDMPSIQVLIMGGGGTSALRTIQRVGRSLRRKPGTDQSVRIVDFYDFSHRLLHRHSDSRLRTYKRRHFVTHVVGSLEEVL